MSGRVARWGKWVAVVAFTLAFLYVDYQVYAARQPLLAAAALAAFSLAAYVYTAKRAYNWRYLFPGLAGMAIFVVFPLLYTVRIGFTNYSSRNLLTFERATAYLLDETSAGEGPRYDVTLHADGQKFRLVLRPRVETPDEGGESAEQNAQGAQATPAAAPARPAAPPPVFETPPIALEKAETVEAKQLADPAAAPRDALPLRDLIVHRDGLAKLKVKLPSGPVTSMIGLREFGTVEPVYRQNPDGTLTNNKTGEVLTPNLKDGFYETPAGEQVRPGFKVGVGFANYVRVATDPDFSGPFLKIFAWTVAFAALTVFLTLCVGMTLAVLLNWEAVRGRTVYRTLLFLPYAVPGFISILVFRGLFNQNFGEINLILNGLFGIRPEWFANEWLARAMILIVNTWLGYPYVMVLCTGLIKAIPYDIYEASALAGAGPLTNFFRITSPLIIKPLTPLLIASFAFNFNNYVLISLLTRGRPDFLDTQVPAGQTDILVTYLNRIAFEDSGQQFGLAAAISTVIFVLVAVLSIVNLRLTKANAQEQRY